MANLRMTLLDLLNKSEQGADPNFLHTRVGTLELQIPKLRLPSPAYPADRPLNCVPPSAAQPRTRL